MGGKRGTPEERFWTKFEQIDGCWLWKDQPNSNGYGRLNLGQNEIVLAHRFSYALNIGLIPDGLEVCHSCDTPLCVRPDHLFVGTHLKNQQDMWTKGRNDGINAKLTATQVRKIRRLRAETGMLETELAAMFDVARTTIADILHRRTWDHVE